MPDASEVPEETPVKADHSKASETTGRRNSEFYSDGDDPSGPRCPQSPTPIVADSEESPATASQTLDVARLVERVDRLEESHRVDPWKRRHVIGVWIALIISSLTLFNDYRGDPLQRRLEVKRLLDDAWALLGGKPGQDFIEIKEDIDQPREALLKIGDALELDEESTRAHCLRGIYLLYYGTQYDRPDAAVSFRRALALDSDNTVALFHEGFLLWRQNKFVEAAENFRRVIRSDYKHPWAHRNLASVLEDNGKLYEAELALRHHMELNPYDGFARRQLKALEKAQRRALDWRKLDARGDHEEDPTISLQRDIERYPDDTGKRTIFGLILMQQGKHEEAEVHFRNVCKIRTDDPQAHYNLAWALVEQNKLVESQKHYSRVLELNPSDNLAELSRSGLERVRLSSDEETYRHASERNPEDPQALYNLAAAREYLGKWGQEGKLEEAVSSYRRVLELNPDRVLAEETRHRMNKVLIALGKPPAEQ